MAPRRDGAHHHAASRSPGMSPKSSALSVTSVARCTSASAAFKGSPMKRAKPRGVKRNAAVVLGNSLVAEGAERAEALRRALDDPEPLVREHAAWAFGRRRSFTGQERKQIPGQR